MVLRKLSHSMFSPLRNDLFFHQAPGKKEPGNDLEEMSEKRLMQKDRRLAFFCYLKTRHPLGLLVHLGVLVPALFLPEMKMRASE